MDSKYVLQIMRDYGRDIECKGSYKLYLLSNPILF